MTAPPLGPHRTRAVPDHPDDPRTPGEPGAAIEIATAITPDDWVDLSLRNARGYLGPHRRRTFARGLAFLAACLAISLSAAWAIGGRRPTLDEILLIDAPASVRGTMLLWLVVWLLFLVRAYIFHDRLMRRRSRRWAVREHGAAPMPVRYRLDAAGMTVTDAHGSAFRAWASVAGLEESERQFFLPDAARGVAVVPKRDLTDAERDRVRAFVRARLLAAEGEPGPTAAALPPEATRGAALHLRYTQTAAERAAASLLVWAMPAGRRRRALNALGAALVVALGIPALDAVQWGLERLGGAGAEPFGPAFAAFLRGEAAGYLWPGLYAAGFGLAFWLAWPWFLRRQADALARLHRDVPVDLALGASGVAVAVPGTDFRYAWGGVRAVLENATHVGLLLPLSVVLPIPKRALDAGRLAALRDLLADRVGRG